MNSVQKKLNDLEKLKKDISAKLDKYEFNFDKEKEKFDMLDLNNKKEENINNNKSKNILGKNYKEIMDKRLDDIMGKIDDNIINKNYSDLYKFLLNASPYKKYKSEKTKQNEEKEIEKKKETETENKEIEDKEIEEYENEPFIKESISRNNNNKNNKQIIQSENEINKSKSISENIEKEELNEQKEISIKNELNKENDKKEKNIYLNYDGAGKTDLEELKSKQNLELLQKQQNIYLSNELITLKNKLNDLRKDNEFLKSVINEKGMVKNTNVLEKFIGKFIERLSLNWDEIVDMIIDEILIDEAYVLNEIDLKKINYEKNKNILIKNLMKAGFGGIIPENEENEENPNTNMDLIFDNVDFIQKVLNNVKQNEKEMKIKYNIK